MVGRVDTLIAALQPDLPRTLFALDFDGTLAPIVGSPADARLIDGADDALRALVAQGASVALVTGRTAETVLGLSGLADLPGLVVSGLYGAQTWRNGRMSTVPAPPELERARMELPELVRAVSSDLWIEDKGLSLVVHARASRNPDAEIATLSPSVRALAKSVGLEVHPGRRVLELRLAGFDKGRALRQLVDPIAEEQVLFAGDDVGDLPAFAVVDELRAEGRRAWSVAVSSAEVPSLEQLTDVRIDAAVDGPAGLLKLLRAALRR